MRENWTDADKAVFRELWNAGMSVEAVAAKTGRTPAAVKRARARLGLPTRQMGPTTMLRIRLPEQLESDVSKAARAKGQSVSQFVRDAIANAVLV